MHHLFFGHPFAELVALILLPGLAFYFLNKKKASVRGNPDDSDTDTPGSSTTPTGTNSGGSSLAPTETANDASSSSVAPSGDCYEVFLSFSGRDTRFGFTDHLYNGLLDARIHTFRDNEELRRGKKIGDDLFAAIKNSKILIPILSVNYGTSSWCLNELVQIMECKKSNKETIVLPIFYKVAPADVRHQIGEFGDKFHKRESRLLTRRDFDSTILKKWKEALEEVSSLKGHVVTGLEGELVKSIVREVLSELITKFELDIPENLIGIDRHVEKVMEFVANNSRATLFVGIHGMGGIGKTTLAKTIYNQLLNQFEYHSFIADIREKYKNGVEQLQNKLIHDILKKENLVRDKDEGIKFLSSNFKNKKVLILLDDVDAEDHLKYLARSRDWFSSGSVIIITTRDESILVKARVDHKHDHQVLDKDSSLILFSRHAFREDAPPSEFAKLTDEVVATTGKLPLSLKVLGSFLCDKLRGVWEDTIKQLRNVPDKEVQETLRISYDSLEDEQHQIFLDIACFFIGTDLRIASYMWDACGFYPKKGIAVLMLRSLIKVGENHELKMHDQLRDLGREIVRQEDKKKPWNRSRLWDSKEVMEVLEEDEGTDKIEAICLGGNSSNFDNILAGKQFKKLRNLRFLDAEGAYFTGDFENSIKKLKWLQWKKCPSTFEAENFNVKELRVLDLRYSSISDEWQGWSWIKTAKELKYLNLDYCRSLESFDFLSAFENLEILIIRDCRGIRQIPSSIGNMKNLVHLDLGGSYMERLPEEVGKLERLELPESIGALQNLKILNITDSQIKELPNSICGLKNLEILNIGGSKIKELPRDIGRLRKLRDLDASRCFELGGDMPESMGNLSSLQRLDLSKCHKLQSLSVLPSSLTYLCVCCRSGRLPSLSDLTHLKELYIDGTPLEKSPNFPFELEILHIDNCHLIKTLDVSKAIHLRRLHAHNCRNLDEIQSLDKLKYLETLDIKYCPSIESLDLSKLERLKELWALVCPNLIEIQGLDGLESLESIDITHCAAIARLDLPKFNLKKLSVQHCQIQVLDGLESLEKILIFGCDSIKSLDLSNCKGLKEFKALRCEKLIEIQGSDRLESLEKIEIWGCASIRRLDLSNYKGLKEFIAESCEKLIEIQGYDRLESLEKIKISGCASIRRLDLSNCKGLKEFEASSCEKLIEIQGSDRLESLEKIEISGCASIRRLDLSKFKDLKRLSVGDCENLLKIQGLDKLELLEELGMTGCTSLGRLPDLESLEKILISGCNSIKSLDLSNCKGLKKFKASSCEKLIEIQGSDRLESLEKIEISGCASIRRLDLSKSKDLKRLFVCDCENLFEIQGLDKLELLKELWMTGCTSLGRLLDLCCFDTLCHYCCGNFCDIQQLERFPSLESLMFHEDNNSFVKFPKLRHLRELGLFNCRELREILGLEDLTSLERIDISGCSSIEILPDLSSLTNLKRLVVRECEKLSSEGWRNWWNSFEGWTNWRSFDCVLETDNGIVRIEYFERFMGSWDSRNRHL